MAEHRRIASRRPPRRLRRSSADQKASRNLGTLEYLLLALVLLGVAITIAMFIVDPSG
jgi:hypothetical protein